MCEGKHANHNANQYEADQGRPGHSEGGCHVRELTIVRFIYANQLSFVCEAFCFLDLGGLRRFIEEAWRYIDPKAAGLLGLVLVPC